MGEIRGRAVATFVWLTGIYTLGAVAWGAAFHANLLWFGVTGIVLGAGLGFMCAMTVGSQRTVEGARDMQFVSGAFFGNIGWLIAGLGGAIWLIRAVLFH